MPYKNLENDSIAVNSFEDACDMARVLLKNGNAVMITEEEGLYIVNYVWCDSGCPDRNDVVFRNRAELEIELMQAEEGE